MKKYDICDTKYAMHVYNYTPIFLFCSSPSKINKKKNRANLT